MQHLRRSICHSLQSLVTVMASVGQRLLHIPQKMHLLISISILHLVIGVNTLFFFGYISVAGPLRRFLVTVLVIVNNLIFLTCYLSVQLMQGSRVRMIFGTSATSEPFKTLIMAGILLKVGTLTRNR